MKKTNQTDKTKNGKTKYTAFRCPTDLLAKAKVKAKQQHRSLSNYIVCLLDEATATKPATQRTT